METFTLDTLKFDEVLSAFEAVSSSPTDKARHAARKKACKITARLFPLFNDELDPGLELSDYLLEQFGYYRSLGMSIADTAYAMHLSSERLTTLLQGKGQSLEKFIELVQQELFSRAELKASLLRDIRESTSKKEWRTSLTLLEKLYPEEFSSRATLEDKLDKLTERTWTINIVDPKVTAETE